MGFKEKFFKNVAVYGGYSYLTWFIDALISTVVLSRFLGPEEYGFVALIYVFSGFVMLFSNTGLNYAIIRSEYGMKYQHVVFSLSIWIGIILAIAMCLLAYPITLIYDNSDLFWPTIVVSLQFISNSVTIVPKAILEKRFDFKSIGSINALTSVTKLVIMILMAVLGFSYWALIIPLAIMPLFR